MPAIGAAQRATGSGIASQLSDCRVERGQTAAVRLEQALKAGHAVEISADRSQARVVQTIGNPSVVAGTQLELPFHCLPLCTGSRKNLVLAPTPLVERQRRRQRI